MKFWIYIILLLSTPLLSFSQNVGIGTTAPSEKLEVKNALRSTVKVSTNSTTDTAELLLSNKTVNGFGTFYTDFSIKSVREEGLFFSSLSDFPANASANSLVIRPNGNVGVGIVPSYKFHINGQSRFNGLTQIDGLNLLEFGAGIAGKELNAGKIGYNAFGTNALAIVGAGTNSTNRAVYFFAEGGITMNGPVDIYGPLKVNGNPGTTGQILTSNGTADPTWQKSSFTNSVRFAASFTSDVVPTTYTNIYTVIYNNSPSDVSISTNTITINKTGLYHIEGFLNGKASFSSSAPSYLALTCDLFLDGTEFKIAIAESFNRTSSSSFTYEKPVYFSQDIYVTAPALIKAQGSISIVGTGETGRSAEGVITGYLISE